MIDEPNGPRAGDSAPSDPTSPLPEAQPLTGNETIGMPPGSLPPWSAVGDTAPGGADPAGSSPLGYSAGLPTGASPTPDLPPPAPVAKRSRRPLAALGAVVGVAAIGAGAAFAVTQLGGEGGNTPEQAVQALLSAAQKGDAIGVAEALAPGERDVLLESGVPLVEQLKRLEMLDPSLDLKKVPGYKAQFSEIKMTSRQLRADLAAVRMTGGQVVSSVNPPGLPIGKFVRELLGDELRSATSTPDQTDKIEPGEETEYVTVKKDGKWYLSLGYSIAVGGGGPLPAAGSGIPAVGADSPDAAVRELLDAAASLDIRRVVQLMDPEEIGVLHEYAGRFVPEAEQTVAEVRSQYSVTFPGLELDTAQRASTATVQIRRIGIDAVLKTSDGVNARASFVGDCLSVTVDNDTKKRCGRDIPKLFEDFTGEPVPKEFLDQVNTNINQQRKGANPEVGFVTVRRNGKWFISPLRTMLDATTESLKKVQSGDLDEARKLFQDLQDGSIDDPSNPLASMFPGDPTKRSLAAADAAVAELDDMLSTIESETIGQS